MSLSIAEEEFDKAHKDDLDMDLFDLMRHQENAGGTNRHDCPMCHAHRMLISRITVSEQQEGQGHTAKIELNCEACKWRPVQPWYGFWRSVALGEEGFVSFEAPDGIQQGTETKVIQEGPDSAPAEEPKQGDLKLRTG